MKVSIATLICGVAGFLSLAAVFVPFFLISDGDRSKALEFFQEHLREPLFIGLLTVATFLFSLKTFIIVTMHDKVYSTPAYEKDWKKAIKLNSSLQRFAPLENFAHLLFLAVLVSLVAASLQFSIGLLSNQIAAAICIASSIWSIALIFVSLFYLQQNLLKWFRFLNETDASE